MTRPQLQLLGSPDVYPPMPALWDGDTINWGPWKPTEPSSLDIHQLADGHGPQRCPGCNTEALPHWSLGRRQPGKGEVFETTRQHTFTARWGTTYTVPRTAHTEAWPVLQFHATRCSWCGYTEVYDLDSYELWTLDDTDYGPAGSHRPNDTPHPAALAAELALDDGGDPDG